MGVVDDLFPGLKSLSGALAGGVNAPSQQKTSGGSNDERDAAQREYKSATDNYSNIMRNTNDKNQRDQAHQRLMKATEAMGKYH